MSFSESCGKWYLFKLGISCALVNINKGIIWDTQMIACVYIHCYITQNDCPWILPKFSSKKSPTKNKQNTTRLLTTFSTVDVNLSPGRLVVGPKGGCRGDSGLRSQCRALSRRQGGEWGQWEGKDSTTRGGDDGHLRKKKHRFQQKTGRVTLYRDIINKVVGIMWLWFLVSSRIFFGGWWNMVISLGNFVI